MKTMLAAMFLAVAAHAEDDSAALAKKLKDVKVTLAQGLKASASAGKPISGKFEIEDGKLQLSIYTAKDGAFSEVVVDPRTGKVVKTEAIASGEDLAAAKSQAEAMASAKTGLAEAVRKAEKANKGYRAVSVVPTVRNEAATAGVTLIKGGESKSLFEKL